MLIEVCPSTPLRSCHFSTYVSLPKEAKRLLSCCSLFCAVMMHVIIFSAMTGKHALHMSASADIRRCSCRNRMCRAIICYAMRVAAACDMLLCVIAKAAYAEGYYVHSACVRGMPHGGLLFSARGVKIIFHIDDAMCCLL